MRSTSNEPSPSPEPTRSEKPVAALYGDIVSTQDEADITVIRTSAPYEPRTEGFEKMFHAGSLEFADDDRARLVAMMKSGPTVVDVHLDRPAVLTPLVDDAAALVVSYGCSDIALLDALFGRVRPGGSLPVDLPRSMAAVVASRTDVPFDTLDPLFTFGHGLDIGEPLRVD